MKFDNDLKFINVVMIVSINVALFLQIINIFYWQNKIISTFMLGFASSHFVLIINLLIYNCKKIKDIEKELYDDLLIEKNKRK